MLRRPPRSTRFPSTTLFRSRSMCHPCSHSSNVHLRSSPPSYGSCRDRKSTRLNSSHRGSSYAVFCLKKNIVDVPLGVHLLREVRPVATQVLRWARLRLPIVFLKEWGNPGAVLSLPPGRFPD